MLNELHFVSKNNRALLNFPYVIPPLISKNKNSIDTLENEISSFGFVQDVCWHYDPLGIILKHKKNDRLLAYVHESKPKQERLENSPTLVEEDLQSASSTSMMETIIHVEFGHSQIHVQTGESEHVVSCSVTLASKQRANNPAQFNVFR